MFLIVHELDIPFTLLAFLSLGPTKVVMGLLVMERDYLFAELARLGFLCTGLLMVAVFEFYRTESAVLACYFGVLFLLVLFFISFGDAGATIFAFVVLARATNIMHSKF